MEKRAAVFACALGLAAALPPGAGAQPVAPGPGPISINSCGPMLDKNAQSSTLFGIPLTSTSSGIQIVFTNESQKVANLINFAVTSNNDSFVIRDVGTFSPGIEITHRYRNGEGQSFVLPQFVAPKLSCTVQSVHFADGTTWRPGETIVPASPVAATPGSPLSANPPNVQVDLNAEARLFMVSSSEKVAAFSERSTCAGIASLTLAATGEAAATYSVKPLSAGSCAATIRDQSGNAVSVPITVH